MQASSNFAELFSEETRLKAKRFSRIIEALAFTTVLFVSGLFTGYWIANQQAKEQDVIQERQHLEEINRLSGAYRDTLQYLTGRVTQAAADANGAANVAEGAAKAVSQAATKVDKAAGKNTVVPEISRDQVNRAVQRANSAITEHP